MSDTLENIELDLDESSELLFKVNIEGASSPASVRLVCESDEISYMFNGYPTDEPGVVQFTIPKMLGKINELSCVAKVEVLIENRYFSPIKFGINFKKAIKVFAEAVKIQHKKQSQEVKVSALPIVIKRPEPIVTINENSKQQVTIKHPKQSIGDSLHERFLKKKNNELSLDERVLLNIKNSK